MKEFIAECLNCGERFDPLKYFGCPVYNYPCANIVGEKIIKDTAVKEASK